MWYFLIYGSGRFIIEQLREDSLYLGGIRASQYLSLVLCVVSAVVLIWRERNALRGQLALLIGAALLLVARWFALENTTLYALLLAPAIACAVVALWKERRVLWLALPLAVDLLGLILLWLGLPTASLGLRIHTLLCSVTLPVYVWVLSQPAHESAVEPAR